MGALPFPQPQHDTRRSLKPPDPAQCTSLAAPPTLGLTPDGPQAGYWLPDADVPTDDSGPADSVAWGRPQPSAVQSRAPHPLPRAPRYYPHSQLPTPGPTFAPPPFGGEPSTAPYCLPASWGTSTRLSRTSRHCVWRRRLGRCLLALRPPADSSSSAP